MFIRQRKNSSGSISVQLIEKINSKYFVVKHFGTANNTKQLDSLIEKAQAFKDYINFKDQLGLLNNNNNHDNIQEEQKELIVIDKPDLEYVSDKNIGYHKLFGLIFDQFGFPNINNIFKTIVVARIAYPKSKTKTSKFLKDKCGIDISVDKIYRLMDEIKPDIRQKLNSITFDYVKKFSGNELSVMYFDATTLHFESFDEDDYRKCGFSKVAKHNQPQILITLLVDKYGLPVNYNSYEGSKFEGHTLLNDITKLKAKYNLDSITVVADAGMMSNTNVQELEARDLKYIIGARIKNMKEAVKEKILSKDLYENDQLGIDLGDNRRLVVSYSESRARKNKNDRLRGIQKLRSKLGKSKNLTKRQLTNRGYQKYLEIKGNATVAVNESAIQEDARWDGLKGLMTNRYDLNIKETFKKYKELWRVEKAFRMAKSDLMLRPVYHYKEERIRAHLAICFCAYAISRMAEIKLKRSHETILDMLSKQKVVIMRDKKSGILAEYPATQEESLKRLIEILEK